MSGLRDESVVLDGLVEAVDRLLEIGRQTPEGMLGCDRDTNEQILWNLLVLGEATKRLSDGLRGRFGDVAWSDMARTRDKIAHHYDAVNWHRVHDIISINLPPLLPRLIEIRDIMRAEFDAAEAEAERSR
jgi:uncharacterized protein with HEPN domain